MKHKDLAMIPAMVAMALRDSGWYLRAEIAWCKRSPRPDSALDRPKIASERIYLLSKSPRYYFDLEATRTPAGRLLWDYWVLSPEPYRGAHTATYPTEIPRRAILSSTSAKGVCRACGNPWRRVLAKRPQERKEDPARYDTVGWEPTCACDAGDPIPAVVLDPFLGSGTTLQAARWTGRRGIGMEINEEYAEAAFKRINGDEKRRIVRAHQGQLPIFKA